MDAGIVVGIIEGNFLIPIIRPRAVVGLWFEIGFHATMLVLQGQAWPFGNNSDCMVAVATSLPAM